MSVGFSALNKYTSHRSKLSPLGIFSTSLSLPPPNSPSENTLLPQANQPCSCSFGFQPSHLLTCPSSSPHPSHAGVSTWRTWDTVCAWFYSELPLSFPVSNHLVTLACNHSWTRKHLPEVRRLQGTLTSLCLWVSHLGSQDSVSSSDMIPSR